MSVKKLVCFVLSVFLAGGVMAMCFTGCFGAKYSVDYDGNKDAFAGAKDEYRVGAEVKLIYKKELIATDTDYSFYLDGETLNPDYNENKGYILKFTMPEHNVKVSVLSENSMLADPDVQGKAEKNPVLSFHSFDGGGPEFNAEIEDTSVVQCDYKKDYGKNAKTKPFVDGAGFDVYFTFTGLKPGKTTVKIEERSPIAGNFDYFYDVEVNDSLSVTVTKRERIDLDAQEYETQTAQP